MATNDPNRSDLPENVNSGLPSPEPQEPAPPLSEDMDDTNPVADPFHESDLAASDHPDDVPFPAGNPETVIQESPETPPTAVPETTGTGSYIAIGCVAVAIVIVLVAILVLTIIS